MYVSVSEGKMQVLFGKFCVRTKWIIPNVQKYQSIITTLAMTTHLPNSFMTEAVII